MQIVNEKLTGDNFHAWKFIITNYLKGKGYWDYVEGANEAPPVILDTGASVEQDADSPKDAWDKLIAFNATNTRGRKIQLKNELNRIKKGDLSMNDYTVKIKALCESLSSIGVAMDDEMTRGVEREGSEGVTNARKRPAGGCRRDDILNNCKTAGLSNSRRGGSDILLAAPVSTSSTFMSNSAAFPFAGISSRPSSGINMQHHQVQLGVSGNASGGPIVNACVAAAATAAIVTPCAACKLLRRRCAQECPFAPYFPPHEPHKFACVHKIYGASNVSKMLMEVPENQRADTANSLVYEANARIQDPVYGCMGVISALQQQARNLQAELNVVKVEVMRYRPASHVENAPARMQIAATTAAAAVSSPFHSNNVSNIVVNSISLNPNSSSPIHASLHPTDNITYISNSTSSATSTDSSIKAERFWSTLG
ncbi:hypothetical protein L7F22_048531 [Adiantum nelumboides]|nr:hypothetical protein [Adiantum nelumboides]